MSNDDKIQQLLQLFSPVYSKEDLVAILDESSLDLEIAISRILTGQTNTFSTPSSKSNKHSKNNITAPKHASHNKKSSDRTPKDFTRPTTKENTRPATAKHSSPNSQQQKPSPQQPTKASVKKFNPPPPQQPTLTIKSTQSWAQLVKGPEPVKQLPEPILDSPKVTPALKNSTNAAIPEAMTNKPFTAKNTSLSFKLNTVTSQNNQNTQNSTEKAISLPPGLLHNTPTQPISAQPTQKRSPVPSAPILQDSPVIMPASLNPSNIGVQFGSLKIGHEQTSPNPVISSHNSQNPAPRLPSAPKKQHPSTSPAPVAPQLNAAPQPSYFPSQQIQPGFPTGVNGEFSIPYATDAQMRGVPVGYYPDPYQIAPKHPNTDVNAPSTQVPSNAIPQAQQYPMHFGYYPYYMPNQYQAPPNGYASYGQFVNKNGYPYAPNQQPQVGPVASGTVTPTASASTSTNKSSNAAITANGNTYAFSNVPSGYGYSEPMAMYGAAPPPGNLPQGMPPFNAGLNGQKPEYKKNNNNNSRTNSRQASFEKFPSSTSAAVLPAQSVTTSAAPVGYYNQPTYQQQQYYMQQQQQAYGGYSGQRNGQTQYWNGQS